MRAWIVALLLVAAVACTGSLSTTGGDSRIDTGTRAETGPRDDAEPPADTAPAGDASLEDSATTMDATADTMVEPPFDAGPCVGGALGARFSTEPVPAVSASGRTFAAPTSTGGAVIAWRGSDGIHLTRVDGAGAAIGSDAVVDGNAPWGLAVTDAAYAVLVDRGSDEIFIVGVSPSGASLFETRILGGVDHSVTNNEWFGSLLRAGRLTWTGTEWAAYVTVQRLWPDGIAHYGDTVRLFDPGGAPARTVWGWGCSHSMEVGIAQNASALGPVCVSDCFPGKGVFFNHRTEMFLDPSGNCAGRIDTRLGGIAPIAGGFLVSYVTPHTRMSADVAVQHVADAGAVGPVVWLTDDMTADAEARIAPFEDGGIAGWVAGGTDRIVALDASGTPVGSAIDLSGAAIASSSDFFNFSNGDVGWVSTSGGTQLARLRACP